MYQYQKETDELRLNQFKGHKVELVLVDPNVVFMYQSFNWNYSDDMESLVLYDEMEDESKYYILLDDIKKIMYLTEDIYYDVIDIVTEKFLLSICTLEDKPLSPICDKCGKDLSKEYVHKIDLEIGFGSRLDGDIVHKKYCDDCLSSIFDMEVDVNE